MTTKKKAGGHQPATDTHAHTTAVYPLLFTFRDVIAGNGFLAGVAVDGRAVLEESPEDGAWFYGVDPGGIAGHGETSQEAHQEFREVYRSILDDISAEAADFPAFEALVTEFLSSINRPNEEQWLESVELVKAGELDLGWLPKSSSQRERCIKVTELHEPRSINGPSAQSPRQSLAA